MAFYSPDPAMDQTLADLVQALECDGRPGLAQQLSITWLRFERSQLGAAVDAGPERFWRLAPPGAGWGGEQQRYPASVVKLVYQVAAEAWLQAGRLVDGPPGWWWIFSPAPPAALSWPRRPGPCGSSSGNW
jgi:hypothetical protein